MKGFRKPLTEKDVAALESAVSRYRAYAKFKPEEMKHVNLMANACGLCDMYNRTRSSCDNCPVSCMTGEPYCINTPYQKANKVNSTLGDTSLFNIHCRLDSNYFGITDTKRFRSHLRAFRKRCIEEADFLQSLLDNNPRKKPTTGIE